MIASSQPVTAADLGKLLIQAMVGVVFMFHGAQKLFGVLGGSGLKGTAVMMEKLKMPFPQASALLVGSAEFFGGLALFLGIGTLLAVFPLVFTMLVACVKVHGHAFSLVHQGMEYALTLGIVTLGIGLLGSGTLSVDQLLSRPKNGE